MFAWSGRMAISTCISVQAVQHNVRRDRRSNCKARICMERELSTQPPLCYTPSVQSLLAIYMYVALECEQ